MKISHLLISPLVVLAMSLPATSQTISGVDSTGLPGDHFSLQGALQMFQKAGSPEEFEKMINQETNSVNNLDLDGNGETDYIRVIDKPGKDVHALVLQVAVSDNENQDIAVIEIEMNGEESALLQIIGDEDIYGEEVIVEPNGENDNSFINWDNNSNSSGPNVSFQDDITYTPIIVNVWLWPSVRFIYAPAYHPWVSPWRWHHYPGWWKPWRPYAWHQWHPRCHVYHRPFAVVHTHRVVRAHAIYRPARVSSVTVRNRHSVAVNNYRVTRKKTTVTGPRGHSATRTTTTVRKNGQVKARKTTIKRRG